jgi:polar amino acid transport system substrate-binding protein
MTRSSTRPRRSRLFASGFIGFTLCLVVALSACGGSSGTGTSTGPDLHLVSAGKLTIASDTTYAPAEFADPANPGQFQGYDMDLARELAKRLNLQPNILKADFGSIISDLTAPALGQGRYDMSISSFTINDDRKQKVDMIPYFTAGESILVQTGNPKQITTIQSMCGKIIAVQDNTVEFDELNDANGDGKGDSGAPVDACKSNKIKIVHNPDQTQVVLAVVNGSADASYQDQPVTEYYIGKNTGKLESGGTTVSPAPQGIVMRKDNPALETAITNALQAMRADGTYLNILKKWGVEKLAYPPLS